MLGEILSMISRGSLSTIEPINAYPLSEIENAFRTIQTGKHMGKVVLRADPEVEVKVSGQSACIFHAYSIDTLIRSFHELSILHVSLQMHPTSSLVVSAALDVQFVVGWGASKPRTSSCYPAAVARAKPSVRWLTSFSN